MAGRVRPSTSRTSVRSRGRRLRIPGFVSEDDSGIPRISRRVRHPDNDASRTDPARRRRKLPPTPANSRNTRAGKTCSWRESPPIPAQPASAKTGDACRASPHPSQRACSTGASSRAAHSSGEFQCGGNASLRILASPNGSAFHAQSRQSAQRLTRSRLDGADDADASETRTATELADRRRGRRLEEIEGRVVVGQEGRATMLDPDPLASQRGGGTREVVQPCPPGSLGTAACRPRPGTSATVLLSAEGEPRPTLRSSGARRDPATYR